MDHHDNVQSFGLRRRRLRIRKGDSFDIGILERQQRVLTDRLEIRPMVESDRARFVELFTDPDFTVFFACRTWIKRIDTSTICWR